jgi:hypothetical protein
MIIANVHVKSIVIIDFLSMQIVPVTIEQIPFLSIKIQVFLSVRARVNQRILDIGPAPPHIDLYILKNPSQRILIPKDNQPFLHLNLSLYLYLEYILSCNFLCTLELVKKCVSEVVVVVCGWCVNLF